MAVSRLVADAVLVAVLLTLPARLVPALGALADEVGAALVAPALLLRAAAVVADDLGGALFAGALAVVAFAAAVVTIADDQLVPVVVLVGAGLGVAAVAVADDALALALLVVVVAGLLGGAEVAVAGDFLLAPFGRRAELGGDGHGLGDFVADGAVLDVRRAGRDGAGCGAGDCACVSLMGRRTGEVPAAVVMLLLLVILAGILLFLIMLVMVFAEPDVQAQDNGLRLLLFMGRPG